MSEKLSKISFGKINRYIILILIGAIFRAFLTFLESQSSNFAEQNKHPIVYSMTYSIGLCLNFILLIIFKIRNKSEKDIYIEKEKEKDKDKNKSNIKALLITEDNIKTFKIDISNNVNAHLIKHISKKEKYLWILMISFVDYIAYVFFCIFWVDIDNYLNTWGLTIGFMSLFSNKILQIKLYKHHYICIVAIIIIGMAFNIIAEKF